MIIDLILDRENGVPYDPKKFYESVMGYGEVGFGIAEAMDNGDELDVKREIRKYLRNNDYHLFQKTINWINSVNWITNA